jgi:hemerythrin-like domain-containing protein
LPSPLPLPLLDQPLEYLFAEHLRHRSYCAMLMHFVQRREAAEADIGRMVRFLTEECALHYADENEDLFPALRRRALPEDDLASALARLESDHDRLGELAEEIVDNLGKTHGVQPARFGIQARNAMRTYAASETRHLAFENAVILSIAGVRLHRNDLRAISQSMKARRGLGLA